MVLSKAWTDLMAENDDMTLLAYTALQIETERPGTVPQELLTSLSTKINGEWFNGDILPALADDAVDYVEDVEAIADQSTDLGKLVAYCRIKQLVDEGQVNPNTVKEVKQRIETEISDLRQLTENTTGAKT